MSTVVVGSKKDYNLNWGIQVWKWHVLKIDRTDDAVLRLVGRHDTRHIIHLLIQRNW